MLPLALDLARLEVALVGEGEAAVRRLRLLDEAGAGALRVFAPDPSPALRRAAGHRLCPYWPDAAELAGADLVFIADLDAARSAGFARFARGAGALVNVEDRIALCDVHMPAILRRGDLLLGISTGGRSPGLAVRLRRFLETLIGPEWGGRLEEIAGARAGWRAQGHDLAELMRRTDALIDRRGWLPRPARAGADHGPALADRQRREPAGRSATAS